MVLLFFNAVLLIEKEYLALIAVLVVDVLFILCCIFANKQKKFLERKEKIIKNGLKVFGKIIGVELINQREDTKVG